MNQFNISKINEFSKQNISFILFVLFFLLYLSIGIILNCYSDTSFSAAWDVVFSLDTKTCLNNFINPIYNSYNCPETHPFALLFIPPITAFMSLFGFSNMLKIIFIQSILGAFSVCLIEKILDFFSGKKLLNILITLIYAFSLSLLIFTSFPENYIFAGTFSIINLYYLINLIKNPTIKKLSWTNILITALCSFCMFAINTICIGYALILFIFFLIFIYKKNIKQILKDLSKFLLIIILLFTFFAILHDIIFSHMNTYKSIFFTEKGFENRAKNIKSFTNKGYYNFVENHLIEGLFVQPFYALPSGERIDIEVNSIGKEWHFKDEHNKNYYIPVILLFGLSFLGFIWKIQKHKHKSLVLCFSFIILLNIFLNYHFCPWECFLYAMNTFVYLITLLGLFLNEYKSYFYCILCSLFICLQIGINFHTLYLIKQFLWKNTTNNYSFNDSYYLIFLAFVLTCLSAFYLHKYTKKYSLEKKYLLFIIPYFCLIIVYGIFSRFYQG